MAEVRLEHAAHQSVPFWRDVHKIAILLQVAFVVVVFAVGYFLVTNVADNLEQSNLTVSSSFLGQPAGIAIGEGPAYSPTDTYQRALVVGIVNTLRVAVTGIILATLLGLVVGISRLSTNWLLRTTAYGFVELVRNTPLLLQLFFWFSLTRLFPPARDAFNLASVVVLTNRGVSLAWPRQSDVYGGWTPWLIGALVLGVGVYIWRWREIRRRDRPGAVLPWALLAAFVVALIGFIAIWIGSGAAPLRIDRPLLEGFNFRGGAGLTSSYFALLTGLVIYTGAYIGEIVRAGIQAVSKGQREAATALGLSQVQSLRLVILPQALRVIIPPLTNQYLNLTKNSSLGIFIAYPDFFFVAATIINQTGQTVLIFLFVMAGYLSVSLATSLLMNWYNRRIQLVER